MLGITVSINFLKMVIFGHIFFQAYIIYYALSNFVIPFIVILFCYSKMCAVLWGNFKQKKAQEKADLITISPERKAETNHEDTKVMVIRQL